MERKKWRKGWCQTHHHRWKYKDRDSSRKKPGGKWRKPGEGERFQIPQPMGIRMDEENNQGSHPTMPSSGGHHDEDIMGGSRYNTATSRIAWVPKSTRRQEPKQRPIEGWRPRGDNTREQKCCRHKRPADPRGNEKIKFLLVWAYTWLVPQGSSLDNKQTDYSDKQKDCIEQKVMK